MNPYDRPNYQRQLPAQDFKDARQSWKDDMRRVVLRRSLKYIGWGLAITGVLVLASQAVR